MEKEGKYVQINKFDPITLVYTCRLIRPKDPNISENKYFNENHEIHEVFLTKFINIQV